MRRTTASCDRRPSKARRLDLTTPSSRRIAIDTRDLSRTLAVRPGLSQIARPVCDLSSTGGARPGHCRSAWLRLGARVSSRVPCARLGDAKAGEPGFEPGLDSSKGCRVAVTPLPSALDEYRVSRYPKPSGCEPPPKGLVMRTATSPQDANRTESPQETRIRHRPPANESYRLPNAFATGSGNSGSASAARTSAGRCNARSGRSSPTSSPA